MLDFPTPHRRLAVGDRAEVLTAVPLAPGSNINLEPGDHVTIARIRGDHCAVRVLGTQEFAVPLRALRFVSTPDVPSTSDPVMDFLAEDLPPESGLPRRKKR